MDSDKNSSDNEESTLIQGTEVEPTFRRQLFKMLFLEISILNN